MRQSQPQGNYKSITPKIMIIHDLFKDHKDWLIQNKFYTELYEYWEFKVKRARMSFSRQESLMTLLKFNRKEGRKTEYFHLDKYGEVKDSINNCAIFWST